MSRARRWLLGLALVLAAHAGGASAQERPAARTLFDEGKRLVEAGDFTAACATFAASAKLDAKIGTKLALGACYERVGRTASAWAEFRDVEAMTARAGEAERGRHDYAAQHAAALQRKLVRLSIVVAAPTPGMVVTRDGQAVAEAELGVALPVDPGEHVLAASAEGYEPWSSTVRVGAEVSATVRVPALRKIETAGPPAPPPRVAPPAVPPAALAAPAQQTSSPARKIIGYGVGAGGVALVGVGFAFGASARSKWNDAKAQCTGPSGALVCTREGVQLHDDAVTAATISTVVVTAGLVAVGGGVALLLWPERARSAERVQLVPAVGPSGAALVVSGGF